MPGDDGRSAAAAVGPSDSVWQLELVNAEVGEVT